MKRKPPAGRADVRRQAVVLELKCCLMVRKMEYYKSMPSRIAFKFVSIICGRFAETSFGITCSINS